MRLRWCHIKKFVQRKILTKRAEHSNNADNEAWKYLRVNFFSMINIFFYFKHRKKKSSMHFQLGAPMIWGMKMSKGKQNEGEWGRNEKSQRGSLTRTDKNRVKTVGSNEKKEKKNTRRKRKNRTENVKNYWNCNEWKKKMISKNCFFL